MLQGGSHCMLCTLRRWHLVVEALRCVCIWLLAHMTIHPWMFRCPGGVQYALCVHECTHYSFVTVCATQALTCLYLFAFLCVQDTAWVYVSLHVHQQGCLLSVCIRRSVFFLLNHWWHCNSNTGPPISSPCLLSSVSPLPEPLTGKTSRLL